jgi:hypothetical protein
MVTKERRVCTFNWSSLSEGLEVGKVYYVIVS